MLAESCVLLIVVAVLQRGCRCRVAVWFYDWSLVAPAAADVAFLVKCLRYLSPFWVVSCPAGLALSMFSSDPVLALVFALPFWGCLCVVAFGDAVSPGVWACREIRVVSVDCCLLQASGLSALEAAVVCRFFRSVRIR